MKQEPSTLDDPLSRPWRVGSHYGIHIYAGETPIGTALSPQFAARIVEDHNRCLETPAITITELIAACT